MKRSIVIALLFLGLQTIFAQQLVVKDLRDFNTLKVFDRISVKLISSSTAKVEISGAKSGEVEVINKNNELKIRMSTLKLLSGDDLEVRVYYTKLNNIQASEGAIISGGDEINTSLLTLNAKEGAEIKIKVDVQKISTRINTGGKIDITGKAKQQDIVIASGGNYYAKDVKSSNIVVAINAGGSAEIRASDSIKARTRAGGTIDIYGSPKSVDKKILAGGKIIVH